jgi:hypothetical protein
VNSSMALLLYAAYSPTPLSVKAADHSIKLARRTAAGRFSMTAQVYSKVHFGLCLVAFGFPLPIRHDQKVNDSSGQCRSAAGFPVQVFSLHNLGDVKLEYATGKAGIRAPAGHAHRTT